MPKPKVGKQLVFDDPLIPSDYQPPTKAPDPDIHTYFGLSYASYLVLNRTRLQGMPLAWQRKFVRMLGELDDRYADEPDPDYKVITGQWVTVADLGPDEYALAGITAADDGGETLYDADGEEITYPDAHRVFVPGPDPIPHYRHATRRTNQAPAA